MWCCPGGEARRHDGGGKGGAAGGAKVPGSGNVGGAVGTGPGGSLTPQELAAELEREHETWHPLRWKKGILFIVSVSQLVLIVVLQQFSYSTIFQNWQYEFIVGYKMFQLVYDQGLRGLLREVLLTAPLIATMQVSSVMLIQGAADYTSYLQAYGATLGVLIASRLYIEPTFKQFVSRAPLYWLTFNRNYLANRKLTREQRLQEEQDFKRMTEEVVLEVEGIEPLLESYLVFSCETAALVIQPFVQLTIFMLDSNPFHHLRLSHIPLNYGIKESSLVYYTVFSSAIIPFQFCMDSESSCRVVGA